MFVAYHFVAIIFAVVQAHAEIKTQLISPCPDLFQYESLNSNEPGRWYGTYTILSDFELSGVWVRLMFDKPVIELGLAGDWSGDVVTEDNTDYLVKNSSRMVLPNTPYKVRFFVKYNPEETPPKLNSFRLNARTVCSIIDGATTTGSFDKLNGEGCGTIIAPPSAHSQATHEAPFPWYVSLYHAKGSDLTYKCAASLLTRTHLITAAHCAMQSDPVQPISPDSLVVYLGKSYRTKWESPEIQVKQVDQIIFHPEYNATVFKNNIAIIKMDSPVEITNYVRPVCLWRDAVELEGVINKTGTVTGWSFDKDGRITEQVTETNMTIVNQETCIISHPDFTADKTFCAEYKSGTTLCNGVSGSGMVFPWSATNQRGTSWQLRGLVSMTRNHVKCEPDESLVFTDVAEYLDWIKDTVK